MNTLYTREIAAVNRLLKAARKEERRESIHNAWTDPAGRLIATDGYRAVALINPLYNPADILAPVEIDEIAAVPVRGAFFRAFEEIGDADHDYQRVPRPDADIVKAAAAAARKGGNSLYHFGESAADNRPAVNVHYLYDMVRMFPAADWYIDVKRGSLSKVFAVADRGLGFILPIRTTEEALQGAARNVAPAADPREAAALQAAPAAIQPARLDAIPAAPAAEESAPCADSISVGEAAADPIPAADPVAAAEESAPASPAADPIPAPAEESAADPRELAPVDVPVFAIHFNAVYADLYARGAAVESTPEYSQAVDDFDALAADPRAKALLLAFADYRQDMVTSDREAAAYIMVLQSMRPAATTLDALARLAPVTPAAEESAADPRELAPAADTISVGEAAPAADPIPAPAEESAPAADPDKLAHGPVPEKTFIGTAIQGRGYKIVFDAAADRTRVIFDRKPAAAILQAVKAASFYYSPSLKSWNKGLTWKAYRAALALDKRLQALTA